MANAIILEPQPPASAFATSAASGTQVANLSRDPLGLVWRSADHDTAPAVTIDLGSDVPIDTIALFGLHGGHQAAMNTIDAGWQWTVELATDAQGAFTGSWWTGAAEQLLAGTAMPQSSLGKALWLAPAGAPPAARHVRITFAPTGGQMIEVARIAIGSAVRLARNFRFGAAFGVRPLGRLEFSQRGVLLRRKGRKLRGVGIAFPHIHRDEVEQQVQPLLERAGNDTALVLVTDPDADAQRQNRMYLGFLTGDLGSVWARPGGWTAEFNLVALD